jgi:hypothetical protein
VRRGWSRVKGTPPGVQTFECDLYGTEVVPADANVAGDQQLKHAREQIAIASQYPGRERNLPSGVKVIELDAGKRSNK